MSRREEFQKGQERLYRMLLSDIDFASLQEMSRDSRWGKDTKNDRRVYRGSGGIWYKIWGREYRPNSYIRGNQWHKLESGIGMPSFFLSGLYNRDLSSAFVEHIRDDDGFIRGYVTREGAHPHCVSDEFCLKVFELGLSVGYLFNDITSRNIVEIGGELSLIDYDSPVVSCEDLDSEFQFRHGVLRPFLPGCYRQLVMDKFSLG